MDDTRIEVHCLLYASLREAAGSRLVQCMLAPDSSVADLVADVVTGKPGAETQRASAHHEALPGWFGSGMGTPSNQFVDDHLERTAGPRHFGADPCDDIVIERQSGSHTTMLTPQHHGVKRAGGPAAGEFQDREGCLPSDFRLELLHPRIAEVRYVDGAVGVHRDVRGPIELSGAAARPSKRRQEGTVR